MKAVAAALTLALGIGLAVLLWSGAVDAHRIHSAAGLRIIHLTDHKVRAAHSCQRFLGRPATHSNGSYKRSPSVRYRRWAYRLWNRRADRACDLVRYVQAVDRDWLAATAYAERIFPEAPWVGSWLRACSSSEGGWHGYVSVGNGEGWMQFLHGTFSGAVGEAFAYARSRGVIVRPEWRSIESRAGQAITAAYMAVKAGRADEWYGRKC